MKKITHAYQNFNIDKFLSAIKNFKEETTREFVIDVIISSIDGYNKSGDDEIYFEMYLEQLVKTYTERRMYRDTSSPFYMKNIPQRKNLMEILNQY